MSAGDAYPAHRTGKAGAQVAQDLFSRAKSSVQAPVTLGCLLGWLHSKELPGSTTGDFPPAGGARREGTDQLESETEGGQVCLNTFDSRFKSWAYPDVADIAPSSRGLSAASLLSWTGPPAPAGLAMKPKNKVTGLLQGSSHGLIAPACPPRLGHLSRGAPSSHTG